MAFVAGGDNGVFDSIVVFSDGPLLSLTAAGFGGAVLSSAAERPENPPTSIARTPSRHKRSTAASQKHSLVLADLSIVPETIRGKAKIERVNTLRDKIPRRRGRSQLAKSIHAGAATPPILVMIP